MHKCQLIQLIKQYWKLILLQKQYLNCPQLENILLLANNPLVPISQILLNSPLKFCHSVFIWQNFIVRIIHLCIKSNRTQGRCLFQWILQYRFPNPLNNHLPWSGSPLVLYKQLFYAIPSPLWCMQIFSQFNLLPLIQLAHIYLYDKLHYKLSATCV